MRGMRKANDQLRKGFRSELRRKLTTVKNDQKAAALALPRVPHEIKAAMSKSLAIEVRERTSRSRQYGRAYSDIRIRLRSSMLYAATRSLEQWPDGRSSIGMAKRTNTQGRWRHMEWGNREKWVDQTTSMGWFDKPFDAARPELVGFINRQLRSWRNQFGGKGYGF